MTGRNANGTGPCCPLAFLWSAHSMNTVWKNSSVFSHPASPPFSDMRTQPVQLASSTWWGLEACLSTVSFNESLNG